MKRKYDFGGYVTRNDLRCADGRVIRHGAFEGCDGKRVPLVWAHQHDDPADVLGHALLENRDDGVYGYCTFNDTEKGRTSKELVRHGDVTSLSIYANQLRQQGSDVIHGVIREVSLVLAGANPGAIIDNLAFSHGDGSYDTIEDEAIISMHLELEHAGLDDEKEDEEEPKKKPADNEDEEEGKEPEKSEEDAESDEEEDEDVKKDDLKHSEEGGSEKTVEEVFNTLTDEQKQAVYAIVGSIVGDEGAGEDDQEGQEDMKHNIFDAEGEAMYLSHSDMEAIFADAKRNGSLKEAVLEHGITDIEVLFPEAQMVGGTTPGFIQRRMEWVGKVMAAVHKSPFARTKSNAANITMEEARARGYIKGNKKVEEQFSVMKRTTDPTTVYKLQKLDRDDIIDITDFDVVAWMKGEMRMMLDEELARAYLVGDGRSVASSDKINELNIRPIWTDDEVFAVHTVMARNTPVTDIIDGIIKAKKEYKGSGQPTMYIGTDLLTEMRLLKDGDGYRRYKSDEDLAHDLRVKEIVEIELFDDLSRTVNGKTRDLGCIIANLADYNVGTNKGGQVNLFDDFDLDYNKYEYLIETRCSGALYVPKSALVIEFADQAMTSMYKTATPATSNPKTEGLYEKEGTIYIPTRDTEVISGKTYYELA